MSAVSFRVGVDLGGTKIEGVVMDPAGELVTRRRVPTPRNDYQATVKSIVDLVLDLERDCTSRCHVGLGTPGAVSKASGMMKNCNSTWLNGRPLKQDLESLLNRPLRLANDADCFALSEATDGAGREASTVFGVILGTGVGGGLVANKRLLSGPNSISGEWGHNPMPWPTPDEWPGRVCYCSRTGCIETFLSGPGMAHDYDGEATPVEIVDRAHQGEKNAQAVLSCYQDRLARALASVINLVDPEVIVLGGGLSRIKELYTGAPLLWGAYVFSDRVDTRLVAPVHGDSSGVRGAAWLWN